MNKKNIGLQYLNINKYIRESLRMTYMSPWLWLHLWIELIESEEGIEDTDETILFFMKLWEIMHPCPELEPCYGCDGWHDEPELEITSDWEDEGDTILIIEKRNGYTKFKSSNTSIIDWYNQTKLGRRTARTGGELRSKNKRRYSQRVLPKTRN